MLDRLGLPRPQIATKLYGAIALALAVVYLLAAATIHSPAARKRRPADPRGRAATRRARAGSGSLARTTAPAGQGSSLCPRGMTPSSATSATYRSATPGLPPSCRAWDTADPQFCRQFAALEQQGALVFGFARPATCRAGACRGGPVRGCGRGAAARRRHRAPAAHAGPRCSPRQYCRKLPVAHRLGVRGRHHRIADRPDGPPAPAPRSGAPARDRLGAAAPRPPRHVDRHSGPHPTGRGGAAGSLGRGVQGQVDRAPAQEGRAREAQFSARCRHQHHAVGPEHVRRSGAPAGVQQAIRRDVRLAGGADAAGHRALRALGLPGEARRQTLPGGRRQLHARGRLSRVHDHRVRQRAHHLRRHAAAQRRRLGGARRGHHPAPPPGARRHAPRAPRCLDGPCQPLAVPRRAAAGAAAPGARPGLRRAVPRSRPLQDRQRHAGPPGRRRAAEAGERAAARLCAPGRPGGASRRRRVRHRPGQRERRRGDRGAGRPHRRYRQQALRHRRPAHRHLHQHRRDVGAARRSGRRPAHQECRSCPLPRQGRWPAGLFLLRAADERAHPGAPPYGDRAAQSLRQRGAGARLPADHLPGDAERDGLRGADAVDASQARERCRRPNSSPLPRRSG